MSILAHPEAVALLADAEVTTADVRDRRARLARFLARYLPVFRRREQRDHAAAFARRPSAPRGSGRRHDLRSNAPSRPSMLISKG